MKARLIRIGNSRGIRIPKALIEAAGLDVSLRLRVVEVGLLLERVDHPRAGWASAARELRDRGEDGLLDDPVPTAFERRCIRAGPRSRPGASPLSVLGPPYPRTA